MRKRGVSMTIERPRTAKQKADHMARKKRKSLHVKTYEEMQKIWKYSESEPTYGTELVIEDGKRVWRAVSK